MYTMGTFKVFDAETLAISSSTTSAAIPMDKAIALALHVQTIAGTTPDVTFTYSVSTNKDTDFITPSSPATIGASIGVADVLDFSPEAAKFIKIIATNNSGVNIATITCALAIQEG